RPVSGSCVSSLRALLGKRPTASTVNLGDVVRAGYWTLVQPPGLRTGPGAMREPFVDATHKSRPRGAGSRRISRMRTWRSEWSRPSIAGLTGAGTMLARAASVVKRPLFLAAPHAAQRREPPRRRRYAGRDDGQRRLELAVEEPDRH